MEDEFNDRHLSEDESTIEKTINYLRVSDPANANREYAIGLLKFMERMAFQIEKRQDLNYDDFLAEYKKSQESK